jgi:tRNA1(Val) A37 N6-methylase TrmN6
MVDLWKRMVPAARYWHSRYLDRRFDRRFGVETLKAWTPEAMFPEDEIPSDAHRHQPVSVLDFEEMMKAVDVPHENYVFLDLGSGTGKALMLASGYGFERIVGVELSRRLHDVAEANLAAFSEKTGRPNIFELHCGDAAEIEWPIGDLFIFLFNPFARSKLESVLERLERARQADPRRLVVLCRRSGAFDLFERRGFLQEVHRTPAFRVYLDEASVKNAGGARVRS